jgi:putative phosphoribosyl transferase
MFRNREDAGLKLAAALAGRQFTDPLVLGIPRGGVVMGTILAKELGAELDVILSQRLYGPGPAEATIGAVTDDGFMFLDPRSPHAHCVPDGHVAEERHRQLAIMARREQIVRQICPRASVANRSVIVTDDGIVTGSTMIAALQAIRPLKPRELIVAVPLAASERVDEIRQWCDDLIALRRPKGPFALRGFYEDFTEISDKQVLQLMREHGCGEDESAKKPAVTSRA